MLTDWMSNSLFRAGSRWRSWCSRGKTAGQRRTGTTTTAAITETTRTRTATTTTTTAATIKREARCSTAALITTNKRPNTAQGRARSSAGAETSPCTDPDPTRAKATRAKARGGKWWKRQGGSQSATAGQRKPSCIEAGCNNTGWG